MKLRNAIDGAQYVEYISERVFCVWHGGHTVNVYHERRQDRNTLDVTEVSCFNVGSFENNSATLQEVKEGIESLRENN